MEPYAVHAIRYGSHERTAAQNFIGGDPHETASNLDYYVWLVSNRDRTLVVDTGFTREEAARRERNVFQEPAEGLARLGIEAARIEDVVITHMHYDHAGSLGAFPKARLHIQDDEMAYCTGRYMAHECFGMPYSTEHVIEMVRAVFAKRVAFHRGDEEIAQASRSTASAGTPWGSSRCGCGRRAAGSSSRPTPPTSTRTWRRCGPSPSSSTCRRWWTDSRSSRDSRRPPSTSSPGTIPW